MNKIIKLVLDAFESSERTRYKPVRRFALKGTNGKWYYGGFLPDGIQSTDEKREYWVMQSIAHGTTHGERFDSEQDILTHITNRLSRLRDDYRLQLIAMPENRFSEQVNYWLKP